VKVPVPLRSAHSWPPRPHRDFFTALSAESGGALNSGVLTVDSIAIVGPKDAAWAKEAGAKTVAELRAMRTDDILAAGREEGRAASSVPLSTASFSQSPSWTFIARASRPRCRCWRVSIATKAFFFYEGMTAEKWRRWRCNVMPIELTRFFSSIRGSTDAAAARSAADLAVISSSPTAHGIGWKWIARQATRAIYRYELDLAAPPASFIQALMPFTPTTSSTFSVPSILDREPCGVRRITS